MEHNTEEQCVIEASNFIFDLNNANDGEVPRLNCTSKTPDEQTFAFAFDVFKLTLSTLGLIGNTISIIVLTRKNNRNSSTAIFVTMMALMDNLSLIAHPIRQVLDRFWAVFAPLYGVKLFCKLNNYIDKTTRCISHWMPVLVTAERVISVRLPLKVKQLCMPMSAIIATASVWMMFTLGCIIQIAFVQRTEKLVNNLTQLGFCDFDIDAFSYSIYGWIEYTLETLLPFIIIVAGNFVIVGHIIAARRMRTKMSKTHSNNSMDKQILTMLAAISISFIITSFPYHFIMRRTVEIRDIDANTYHILYQIFDFLPYFNSCINFILFFLSGSRFRAEVKRLFTCSTTAGNVYGTGRTTRTRAREVASNDTRSRDERDVTSSTARTTD